MLKFLASFIVAMIAILLALAGSGPVVTLAAVIGFIAAFAFVVTLIKDAKRLRHI